MERRTGAGLESFVAACAHPDNGAWARGHEQHIIGAPTCTICHCMWRRSNAPGTFLAASPRPEGPQ